jgi:hypothetical protein
MIRGVLYSPLAESIMKLLFQEFKKASDFRETLRRIVDGDYDVKLPGLSFNAICDNSQASRTTVHATLTVLLKKYRVLRNEEGYVQTAPGKRLAIIYRLRPEAIPVLLFLFPSVAENNL